MWTANKVLQSYQLKCNYILLNKSGTFIYCTYFVLTYQQIIGSLYLTCILEKMCIFLTIKLMPVIKPVNGKNHDNWPSCSKMNKAGTSLWIKKNLRGTQSYKSQVL